MHLLGVALEQRRTALVDDRLVEGIVLGGQMAEQRFRPAHHGAVIDVAGHHIDHAARVVMGHIVEQMVPPEARDVLLRAEDRAAERLPVEGGAAQRLVDHVLRLVGVAADLLDDHATLLLHLLFREDGVEDDVADDLAGDVDVLGRHLRVIGGDVVVRVGVELAAAVLDLQRDAQRVAAFRSLEDHVLQEMGDAVHRRPFVARPDADPDAAGHRAEMRQVVRQHAESVGEGGQLDRHTGSPGRARDRPEHRGRCIDVGRRPRRNNAPRFGVKCAVNRAAASRRR
nr:hypothetical protein [Azospirillum brasilense]